MNATQLALPTHTYNDHAPYRATDTSASGAKHIEPKRLSLQQRVILALYETPGLTDAGLDRTLGTELGRSARPRRRELMLAGCVEECGKCLGDAGVLNAQWQLTIKGEGLAAELLTTARGVSLLKSSATADRRPAAAEGCSPSAGKETPAAKGCSPFAPALKECNPPDRKRNS